MPRDIQSLIHAQGTGGAIGLEREIHGAGAIIKFGTNIRGLTTAASPWVVASIGLAAVGTAIAVLSLWPLHRLVEKLELSRSRRSPRPRRPEHDAPQSTDGDVGGATSASSRLYWALTAAISFARPCLASAKYIPVLGLT